jgi:prefoldin subunit 5
MMESFDSLVASAAKQQKTRSELRARLSALSSQVSEIGLCNVKMEEEELLLRSSIDSIVRINDELRGEMDSLLKSLGADKAAHRSLNLTLDGLNEKRRQLQENIQENRIQNEKHRQKWADCYAMSKDVLSDAAADSNNVSI